MSTLDIEIHEQSKKIMRHSLIITFVISSILYLVFGISGYIKLGENIKGDVLLSIKGASIFINILKLLISISVTTAILLTIHPAADGLMNVLKEINCRCNLFGYNKMEIIII